MTATEISGAIWRTTRPRARRPREIQRLFHAAARNLVRSGLMVCLAGWPVRSAAAATNVLTEAAQIIRLSRQEAAQRRPVLIKGVVTCHDDRAGLLFVQDQTAGVFVFGYRADRDLAPGQRVEVQGQVFAGKYTPVVGEARVRVLAEGERPVPRFVSLTEIHAGTLDSQWVQVSGVVRAAREDWGHMVLELAGDGARLPVRILRPDGQETNLLAATVRIRGVVGTSFNRHERFTGFTLLTGGSGDVEVVQPAVADLFSLPLTTAGELALRPTPVELDRLAHLKGTVTLCQSGKVVYLMDASGPARVECTSSNAYQPGDVVEAVGFLARGPYTAVLQDAQVRMIGHAALPLAIPLDASRLTDVTTDKRLVTFECDLLGQDQTAPDETRLTVGFQSRLIEVRHAASESGQRLPAIPAGSRLRVTGICALTLDAEATPLAVAVRCRSAADVQLLREPVLWKPGKVIWVVGTVSLIALLLFVRLVALQAGVRNQLRDLEARETLIEERSRELYEKEGDGLIAIDVKGSIRSINKAGERLLGWGETDLVGKQVGEFLAPPYRHWVQRRLGTPIRGATPQTVHVCAVGRDGRRRMLKARVRAEYTQGIASGWRCVVRDVTVERRMIRALRRSEYQLRSAVAERERIARDLHDNIIQSIYAVGLAVEEGRRQVAENPVAAQEQLGRAVSNLNGVIRDVRSFIVGLEPEQQTPDRLELALKTLMLTIGHDPATRFEFKIDAKAGNCLLPSQVTQLLHIAREAISNSLRHAKARNTIVSLTADDRCYQFTVQDDGTGFDGVSGNTSGRGLLNMSARAREMKAKLEIRTRPGEGTTVAVSIPRNP